MNDKANETTLIRTRKNLDGRVYPQLKQMLEQRNQAKEACRRIEELTGRYQQEKGQLEGRLTELKEQRRNLMVKGEDISALSAEIQAAEDRLAAITDFLPDPKKLGTENEVQIRQRAELSRTQRDLSTHTRALIRPIHESFQSDIDHLVDQIEAAIVGYETALADFCLANSIDGVVSTQIWVRPVDYMNFTRRTQPRR